MADLYVGIDQSYTGFGLAFFWPNSGKHEVLRQGFDPKKTGPGINRLIHIDDWLLFNLRAKLQAGDKIRHTCMEGYNRGARNGREESGELGATVKRVLLGTVPGPAAYPTIVPPTSLKKFVTGTGNAAKAEMLLGVYKKWGADFRDDNEADAYALARLAHVLDTKVTTHRYEADVLNKLQPHTEKRTAA